MESRIIDTNGQGHGALAELLHALNADILICGGIGGGAQMALTECGDEPPAMCPVCKVPSWKFEKVEKGAK